MAHIRAGDPQVTRRVSEFVRELACKGWYHSFELPNGRKIDGHQSVALQRERLARFGVPEDLRGKRVLDIGCWDGWFSFEMERRGAEVVAADIVERETFGVAREALGSQVEFVLSDVYHLTPDLVGRFDIVLFLGVLYHLKHPLLALERVCALTTDLALVESFVIDDGLDPEAAPMLEYYENEELLGRFDNWCGPNTACVEAFCRTAGFATVESRGVTDQRAHFLCGRQWPAAPSIPRYTPPVITGVVNQRNGESAFDSRVDEYASVFFKSGQPELTRATVLPEIDGFGVCPVSVTTKGGVGWQVDCRIPLDAVQAVRSIRLRTSESEFGAAEPFTVDAPRSRSAQGEFSGVLDIRGVADSATWEDDVVRGDYFSVWVHGMPEATPRQVRVLLGNTDVRVLFVSPLDRQQLRQINVRLPVGIAGGEYEVTVRYGKSITPSHPLRVERDPKTENR